MPDQGKTPGPPWYAEGLQFECQPDCGACCTNHGKYAYVYLTPDDLIRLGTLLELSPEEFLAAHTELDEDHIVLKMDQPDCPFLDGLRCTVYEARPQQCRTFPFWQENLRSRKSWNKLSKFCPGIDRGGTHALPVIQRHLESGTEEE